MNEIVFRDSEEKWLLSLPESKERVLITEQTFYFTGKPCKNKHLSARYTSSGNCVKCIEEKRDIVFTNRRGRSSKRSLENQKLAEEAFTNGYTTYNSLNPCPAGHYERYCTNNNCVECNKLNHKDRKEYYKWKRIEKLYGLTKTDFLKLLDEQQSQCSICEISIGESSCHIDHCHDSGKVRGLLCGKCNQGIGLLNHDLNNLTKAIKYLSRWN